MLTAGTHMFRNICRQSSGGVVDGKTAVRRAVRTVVSFSTVQLAILSYAGADHLQKTPIIARYTSILYAGTSSLCSAVSVLHADTDCLLRDVDDVEGFLLSLLPFRSPEFNKKDDAGCLDGWRVGVLRR